MGLCVYIYIWPYVCVYVCVLWTCRHEHVNIWSWINLFLSSVQFHSAIRNRNTQKKTHTQNNINLLINKKSRSKWVRRRRRKKNRNHGTIIYVTVSLAHHSCVGVRVHNIDGILNITRNLCAFSWTQDPHHKINESTYVYRYTLLATRLTGAHCTQQKHSLTHKQISTLR